MAITISGDTPNFSAATITTGTVTTLNAPSGVLATQNGMTGIAKAWVYVTGAGVVTAFNVSSVTISSNTRIVNFTTAMVNANYAYSGTGESTAGALRLYARNTALTRTTTQLQLENVFANNSTTSPTGEGFVCIVFGT
jgi:hypothetical protein